MSKQVYGGNNRYNQVHIREDCGKLKHKIVSGNNPAGRESLHSTKEMDLMITSLILPASFGGRWQIPKCCTTIEASNEFNEERVVPGRLHATEQEANGEGRQNDVSAFSLFHFGGPVALSTGCKSNPVPLKDEVVELSSQFSADHVENGHGCN
ncbi:hypothetical protein V6N13_138093 [Hibiscus sabdariffa]|uniref:Uncharacterized protein n=1 Tax=Hibiscus sabdariffa TaxID=183260 RepID=A0ABR2QCF3_9ROSI